MVEQGIEDPRVVGSIPILATIKLQFTMINVEKEFKDLCHKQLIPFVNAESVRAYDDSTLFCVAGMQRFTADFLLGREASVPLIASIQACFRSTDLDEAGDGTHFPYFRMLGLFSFEYFIVPQAIAFWFQFAKQIGLRIDYVTIHPDKFDEWSKFYAKHGITDIRKDDECVWTNGNISGYCTEFYHNDIEVGNIVNPFGTCIDCGFGLERISNIINSTPPLSRAEVLSTAIVKLISEGFKPESKGAGYVLRKLIRLAVDEGVEIEHQFFTDELDRRAKHREVYSTLLPDNLDKSPQWWWETHGIDITQFQATQDNEEGIGIDNSCNSCLAVAST